MKIRSRLLTIFAIVLIYTMASGIATTGAWFTDTASSSGAIISSGSLDLQISGGPLVATHLAPGEEYTSMGSFCTKNVGTLDLKYRGLFKVNEPSSSALIDHLSMKVDVLLNGTWTPFFEVFGNAGNEEDRLIHYFQIPGQAPGTVNRYILTGYLNPEEENCYRFSVKLDSGTPDSMQNQSLNFMLDLYATQVTQPGW